MVDADPKWWTQEDASRNGSWRRVTDTFCGWDLLAMTVAIGERPVWRVYIAVEGLSEGEAIAIAEGEAIAIGDTRPPHDPPTRKIVADLLRRWIVKTMGKAANVLDALEAGK